MTGAKPGSRTLRTTIVVSTPGNMARRAEALKASFPLGHTVDVVVRPAAARLPALALHSDVVYVIDAGRNGFRAGLATVGLRGRVVFEIGDPQAPLFRVQGRSRLVVGAGAAIDRLVARHADGVVVRGRRLAALLDVRVPWIELPDGVDLDRFRPIPADALRRRLFIPDDRLVVGLVGNVGPERRPGLGYGWDLVEALATTRDEAIHGVVVGGGSGLPALRRRAEALGLGDRLTFTGAVPHSEVPEFVNLLDVCISTQTNDAVGQARTTAKLPEYLACDRFVLATDVGGAADVLPPEMRVPYSGSWDSEYPRRLAERLATLVTQRDDLRRGANTRAIARSHYGYAVLAPRLAAFLLEIARGAD
jgi:glycosyltransferase involved in cell wall biosynthesis